MNQKDNIIKFLCMYNFKQINSNDVIWEYKFTYRIQSLRVYVFEKYLIIKFCGQDSMLVSDFMFYKNGLNAIKDKIFQFIDLFNFFKL